MMSQQSKRELLEAIQSRYLKARRSEKKIILDEFVAATGYHRKYATRLLKHGRPRHSAKKHGLPKVYHGAVVAALEQIWEICGRICSKRLHPFLPEMVKVLERCGELQLPLETKTLLLQMSSATMDRCLRPVRFAHPMVFPPPNQVPCSRKPSRCARIPLGRGSPRIPGDRPGGTLWGDGRRPICEHVDLRGCLHGLDRVPGSTPAQPANRFRSHPGHAGTLALPFVGDRLR